MICICMLESSKILPPVISVAKMVTTLEFSSCFKPRNDLFCIKPKAMRVKLQILNHV
jgi:hypothetical protein